MTSEPPPSRSGKLLSVEDYAAGIKARDRSILARAITLIESTNPQHRALARAVLDAVLPHTGHARRIGITGVPGVGKSTTIDQLGINLVEAGHSVAVLAVDPSSRRTGGSILGDKTRMTRLAASRDAFIRPSPAARTLGGVTARTRETMVLVEAAGFDVVIVETVGVGQSETAVADMVDVFLVLLLAGGGDELQGIKKGIIELADMIAINKADGANVDAARRAAAEYEAALHLLARKEDPWQPPVFTISAQDNAGLDRLWSEIERHRALQTRNGRLAQRRQEQAVAWLHEMLDERIRTTLMERPGAAQHLADLEGQVRDGRRVPSSAVEDMIATLGLA